MNMRHWKVELVRGNQIAREWAVWAEDLTIGSHLDNKITLPPPFPPNGLVLGSNGSWSMDSVEGAKEGQTNFSEPMVFHWGSMSLRIVNDTPERLTLWDKAQQRMAIARRTVWVDPQQHNRVVPMALMIVVAVMGVGAMGGMILKTPKNQETSTALPESIIELVQEQKEEEKEKEPEPEPEDAGGASDQPPTNPNEGGATETRTVAWPPNSPADVMQQSVMDKINTMSDGLLGEAVDASELNVIDAILAGGGGSLQRGERGGRGASGDGDRMAGMGGIGLGTGGRAGWGTGDGGTRQGDQMRLGAGGTGTGVRTRARVAAPRPSDIELGGAQGTRSPESILRVIRAHIGGFRFSYEKHLRDNPQLGGRISLRFTISAPGDIIEISIVSSNTGSSSMDQEIMGKARRMKFDAIESGNVTVTYAFVLDTQ